MKIPLLILCLAFSPIAMALSPKDCQSVIANHPKAPPATVDDFQLQKVIANKYDTLSWFNDGLAQVQKDGKYGFINETGQEVISVKYDSGSEFSDGFAFVSLKGKMIVIDKQGKFVETYDAYKKKLVNP